MSGHSVARIPIRIFLVAALVAVAAMVPVRAARATGSQYYVATDGSDSNPGSLSKPWRTVEKGLESLQAGDTLLIRQGTYVERITSPKINAGTPTSRIVVKAYPGERPVIKGLLWITGADYWVFNGVNVTWDSATGSRDEHMVKLTNGVGWVFRNAELWGAHSYADLLVASTVPGEPANWIVAKNCIHDNYGALDHINGDHLIYVNTHNTPGGIVRRNILFNALNGMGVKLGSADVPEEGPANVLVYDNTIYNTSQSILVAWSAQNNELFNNLMDKVDTEHNPNYGNIRGYQLTGLNNRAHDNLGYEAHSMLLNHSDYTGIEDQGSEVFPRDPKFDSVTSCSGFHPSDPTAEQYGRYMP